jgi:hypothetical protein
MVEKEKYPHCGKEVEQKNMTLYEQVFYMINSIYCDSFIFGLAATNI